MSRDDSVQTSDLLRPRHVGQPIRRTEDPRLLTGNGEYTADRKPDRVLHVAFRRSEYAHADIVRIDVTRARAAPGPFAASISLACTITVALRKNSLQPQ